MLADTIRMEFRGRESLVHGGTGISLNGRQLERACGELSRHRGKRVGIQGGRYAFSALCAC